MWNCRVRNRAWVPPDTPHPSCTARYRAGGASGSCSLVSATRVQPAWPCWSWRIHHGQPDWITERERDSSHTRQASSEEHTARSVISVSSCSSPQSWLPHRAPRRLARYPPWMCAASFQARRRRLSLSVSTPLPCVSHGHWRRIPQTQQKDGVATSRRRALDAGLVLDYQTTRDARLLCDRDTVPTLSHVAQSVCPQVI